jgi:AcrR family transcriptional regulator
MTAAAKGQTTSPGRSARERIVRAARRMFYARGIRAVGVEAIVAEAGVTKMSLYRHFASKDELVAACLAERIAGFWAWWDAALARAVPEDDARAQILAMFEALGARAITPGFRGCPMTNAAIEFPEADHPGRQLSAVHKRELRERLETLGKRAGARDPVALADGLTLLFEGAYASSQTFGPEGPARSVARAAEALLAAQGCAAPPSGKASS